MSSTRILESEQIERKLQRIARQIEPLEHRELRKRLQRYPLDAVALELKVREMLQGTNLLRDLLQQIIVEVQLSQLSQLAHRRGYPLELVAA